MYPLPRWIAGVCAGVLCLRGNMRTHTEPTPTTEPTRTTEPTAEPTRTTEPTTEPQKHTKSALRLINIKEIKKNKRKIYLFFGRIKEIYTFALAIG